MGALSGQCCVTLNIIHEINSNDSVFVYTIQNNARPEYQKNKLLWFLCNILHKYPSQTTQYSMHFWDCLDLLLTFVPAV